MSSEIKYYPTDLNPFGDEEDLGEEEESVKTSRTQSQALLQATGLSNGSNELHSVMKEKLKFESDTVPFVKKDSDNNNRNRRESYPADLDPFAEDAQEEEGESSFTQTNIDNNNSQPLEDTNYDDSLNPFGSADSEEEGDDSNNPFFNDKQENQNDSDENDQEQIKEDRKNCDKKSQTSIIESSATVVEVSSSNVVIADETNHLASSKVPTNQSTDNLTKPTHCEAMARNFSADALNHSLRSRIPESLQPPVPMPRTKSLLKRKQLEVQSNSFSSTSSATKISDNQNHVDSTDKSSTAQSSNSSTSIATSDLRMSLPPPPPPPVPPAPHLYLTAQRHSNQQEEQQKPHLESPQSTSSRFTQAISNPKFKKLILSTKNVPIAFQKHVPKLLKSSKKS